MDCDCKVSGYFGAASVVVSKIIYCPLHASAPDLVAENKRLTTDRDSWRRTAERLEQEKVQLKAALAGGK